MRMPLCRHGGEGNTVYDPERPPSVDRALRRKAAARKLSLNKLLLEALEGVAGVHSEPRRHHDLDAFIGSWVDDPGVDRALAEVRTVDAKDWE